MSGRGEIGSGLGPVSDARARRTLLRIRSLADPSATSPLSHGHPDVRGGWEEQDAWLPVEKPLLRPSRVSQGPQERDQVHASLEV